MNQLLKIIGMKWVKTELLKCSIQKLKKKNFYTKRKQFKQYCNDVIMDSVPSHWVMNVIKIFFLCRKYGEQRRQQMHCSFEFR